MTDINIKFDQSTTSGSTVDMRRGGRRDNKKLKLCL